MSSSISSKGLIQGDEAYGWRALSVTTLGVMLCFVNASTLNVALPVVARDLSATPAQASWILLSYMLVTTVMILTFGRLADLLGRKQLYLAGLAVLTAGSVGCALAHSIETLIAFRCVQAIGAAAVITNTSALLTDAFPLRMLGLGLGINATLSAAAQGLGPVLGGIIVGTYGWRAIFWLNLPLGLAALWWAWASLRSSRQQTRERFDALGSVLSMAGMGGLVYALSMGGPEGWTSPGVLAGATAGAVALAAFIFTQSVRRHPLVDLRLFSDRNRALAFATVLLVCMAHMSSILLVALYLQAVHGYDAFHAGLSVAPVPLGTMLASAVAARLIGRHADASICMAGMLFTATGLLLLAYVLNASVSYSVIGACLALIGIGHGLFLTPNNNSIMQSVEPQRRGIANAIRAALQNSGYVTGAALALSIATSPLSPSGQKAAYAGRLSSFPREEVLSFVLGCQLALVVLCGICMVAVALSKLFHKGKLL